jgi:hypothetical protein
LKWFCLGAENNILSNPAVVLATRKFFLLEAIVAFYYAFYLLVNLVLEVPLATILNSKLVRSPRG